MAVPDFNDALAYWRFEESYLDEVAGRELNDFESPSFSSEACPIGDFSVRFQNLDGLTDSGQITGLLTDVSVSAWVRAESITSYHVIYAEAYSLSFKVKVALDVSAANGNRIRCTINDAPGTGNNWHVIFSDNPLPIGEWHHVVWTRSAANGMKLYVDGVLQTNSYPPIGDGPAFNGTVDDVQSDSFFRISHHDESPSFYIWDGYIDEFIIYGREITQEEISSIYSATEPYNEGSGPVPIPSNECTTAASANIALFGFNNPITTGLVATFGYLCFTGIRADVITDYCSRALDRLAEQFEDKINLATLICAFTAEVQELELVIYDLFIKRSLDSSTGAQLDGIGEIVGKEREPGQSDDDYRTAIRIQIGINNGSGEPETLIAAFKELTNANNILYQENYPAGVVMYSDGGIVPNLKTEMEKIAPAGVDLNLVVSGSDPSETFAFSPEGGIPDPDGLGFEDPPDLGGIISERVS